MKSSLLKAYIPFCFIWLLDYFIKAWFLKNPDGFQYGYFSFIYFENHGIIMGNLSHIPVMLKNVFLSTAGFALVASLPLSLALYDFKSDKTVYGLSLVLAGILGNVTDRMLYGYVIDYLQIRSSLFTTPVMNFADIVQWFGYVSLTFGLYQEIYFHNPDEDKRRGGWVNRPYQLKFSLALVSICLSISIAFVAFGYTFVKYSLIELETPIEMIDQYLQFFTLASGLLLVIFSLVILLIGKIVSHRIAGPCLAIKRYLEDTINGKRYPFRLRENDYLKELEGPLTEMNQVLAATRERIPEIPEEARKPA